jgi:hypothetical protein
MIRPCKDVSRASCEDISVATEPTPVGALFARAIALFARHAGPLLAAFAVFWIPQIVVALFVGHAAPAPVPAHQTPLDTMHALVQQQVSAAPLLAFMLLVAPLGNLAVIVMASGYVMGEEPAVGTALRRAAGLWAPAIAVTLLGGVLTAVVLLAASIVLGLASLAVILIAGGVNHAAVAPFTMATGVAGMLIGLGLTGFVWATLGMATVTLVLEDPQPLRAARIALRRVLERRTARRTFRVGCVYLGVQLGAVVVLDAVGWPVENIAHGAVSAIAGALGGAAVSCVLLTFLLLYTLEVRVEREGADLLAAADTLADDADRELIERFLTRRDALAPAARTAVAARIADRMRPKLRASFAHLDDEALLEHLARSTF